MDTSSDIQTLRARDFWTSLVLIAVSLFFLWRTLDIPLWGDLGGVKGIHWYDSAAIVPLFIFGGMLVLSLVLLTISIRSGGAAQALGDTGISLDRAEALRVLSIGLILLSYIVGLVPRVDFILSSGLLITALIYGYWGGHAKRAVIACVVVCLAGFFAFLSYPAQADWGALGDDWVTLVLWIGLLLVVTIKARDEKVLRFVPLIAVLAPFILVTAMAFGFRQNVPARTGLLFKHIEYHYYVTLRPLWKD